MNVVTLAWRAGLLSLMACLFGCGGGGGGGNSASASPTENNPPPQVPEDPADPADPEDPEDPEDPLEILQPIRDWSFNVRFGDSFVPTEVLSGTQVGGRLQELVDFGVAVSDLAIPTFDFTVPVDGRASGYIFGTADGKTYGLYVEAPFGPLGEPFAVGSDARLEQRQSFIKRAENATLEFTVTQVLANTFAQPFAEENVPGGYQRIEALVFLDVDAYTHSPRRVFFRRMGAAGVMGRHQQWSPNVHGVGGSGRPLWERDEFDFQTEDLVHPTLGPFSLASIELIEPKTYVVDLSAVAVGETFTLRSTALVSADNPLGDGTPLDFQGSGANVYLRDPFETGGGTTVSFTGLELTSVDVAPPEEAPAEPAPCTSTPNPNPAAGSIQFAAANYFIRESGNVSFEVGVTRTGGSAGAVSATLRASSGTAISGTDFRPLNTSMFFEDGEATPRIVDLRAIANAVDAENKTLTLTLSEPGGCVAIGAQSTATVTILDDDGPPPAQTFTIGGTVTGLTGTGLVIRDGSFRPLTPGNGAFTFASPIASGLPYEVLIVTQPSNPAQVCTLSNGRGVVANANITNVLVSCAAPVSIGSLDSGFGEAGRVTVGLPGGAAAAVLQSDGKIVAVGGLRLVRYHSDGTVDSGFGSGGSVNVTFNGGGLDRAQDVAVQADGKILVAGFTRVAGNDDFAVARYNGDGTPDGSFGTAGRASVDFAGAADQAWAVLIQSDGRIVLAGHAGATSPAGIDNDFAIARFTSGGVLDNAFGTLGKTRTNIAGRGDLAFGAALQGDDKIILTGRVAVDGGASEDTGVARYSADGSLDSSFSGGTVRRNLSVADFGDQGLDVVVQADGKILIAGFAQAASAATFGHSAAFALSRLNANGSVDTGFGSGGLVTSMFTTQNDFGRGVAVQGDGRIVVVGQRSNQSSPDFGVARYQSDGLPDASFGSAGLLAVDFFGGGDDAQDVLIQPDGKVVVFGSASSGTGTVLGMIRINP